MSVNPEKEGSRPKLSIFRNWFSLAGLVVIAGSFFAFLFLFTMDLFRPTGNPYMGILAYLVAPAFTLIGVFLIVLGLILEQRQLSKHEPGWALPRLMVDLSRPRDRRNLAFFIVASAFFLLITAIGSYQSYHFTESTTFCGQSCHTVMQPEFTTYLHSPHARVACSECHIGPGASWYVKSKISGTYQVYATLFDKFPRPIKTPIRNLRPAQETCEQCHWPKKFVGNLDRTYSHFLSDETNSPYSVRLLLKVGGGDPTHGPVGGIHWHMNIANKVEYIATDELRQTIPWVRVTDQKGAVTEYRIPGFKDDPGKHVVRKMDCMDCHNRPTHIFQSPNDAVDQALSIAQLDRSMPSIKKEAVGVLTRPYATEQEARRKIAAALQARYGNDPRLKETIEEVQKMYSANFFPEMKSNWRVYPDNVGHKNWLGCFRCHDGEHKSADQKKVIEASDCNACHVILAQGSGAELEKLNANGWPFHHPGGDFGDLKCNDCHDGKNQ